MLQLISATVEKYAAVALPYLAVFRGTDYTLIILGILTLFLAYLYLRESTGKKARLPPGPRGFPLLGYIPYLGRQTHLDFHKICQQYGNVCRIPLGNQYITILGDYESVKEALLKDEILGRPEHSQLIEDFADISIIDLSGPIWREQRRFALTQLRNVGLGKKDMEIQMREEVSEFIKEIAKYDGQPFNILPLLEASMSNNITALLFGKRLDYTDPIRIQIDSLLRQLMAALDQASYHLFLPRVISWFLKRTGLHKNSVKVISDEMRNIIGKSIEQHERNLDENNPRDFVDLFLIEMNKRAGTPEASYFNRALLSGNALLFFIAGSETVKTTLSWLLNYVAANPHIQEKAYQEIVNVIGKERMPSWSDHTKLPYCEALIAEVHRASSVLPVSVARCALADVEVQGYLIPKGTWIFPNFWAVHNDPKYWKDPKNFRPERFLNEDGTKYLKNERVIPFSIGRRSCPGEQMAHVELFLYTVAILQHFKIFPQDGKKIELKGTLGGTFYPLSVNVVFRKRT